MSFGGFVSRTLANNPLLVVDNSQCCDFDYKFNSPDGHSYTFNLWSSPSDKYAPTVTAIDGVRQPSFTTFPLATGPHPSEDGHDGVLHISSPACPTQLLLNYSNWRNATISGPACHTWSVPMTAEPWRSRISDKALVSSSLQHRLQKSSQSGQASRHLPRSQSRSALDPVAQHGPRSVPGM